MFDHKQFDQWALAYDTSVASSDEENTYPFAGYGRVLEYIFDTVMQVPEAVVLDIGFGTGVLPNRLYENGCTIYGQDFSKKMIEIAGKKMPDAHLYEGDFSKGLCEPLKDHKYDFIIATYSLHHLSDEKKNIFLPLIKEHLKEGGKILIGDVAFETRKDLAQCRLDAGEAWDEEEWYFVEDEVRQYFPDLVFVKVSKCAGVLIIGK